MTGSSRSEGGARAATAWTWVSGPSTHSGRFGHITGAVEDAGDGTARIVILRATHDGRLRAPHVLHSGYRIDDHIAPGLARLNQSTFLAAFTGHGDGPELGLVRLRIDGDGVTEEARRTVVLPARASYAHVLDVGDPAGRLLVITRALEWSPTGLWVHPDTLRTSEPFVLLRAPTESEDARVLTGKGGRPYVVTRQLAGSALVALVHDHPSAFRNGIVVAELAGDQWRALDGTPLRGLDEPSDWDAFATLDEVVPPGGEWVPWVHDVARDVAGSTAVAWSERRRLPDGSPVGGLRYRVADLRSGTWRAHPPLEAGEPLYPGEPDYAGGICFAEGMTDRVWVVSSVDPITGEAAGSRRKLYEIQFAAEGPQILDVSDEGPDDVMRPRVSVTEPGGIPAVWHLRGSYRSYKEFQTRAVIAQPSSR